MAWLDPPWTWVSQNSPLPKHVFLQAGWGGCLVAITFWEAFATLPVYPCSKAAPQRGWDCNRCEVGRATKARLGMLAISKGRPPRIRI